MRILFLAPQPFYQVRGTPIAVNNFLKVLSERGDQVDVITYHEGWDVKYEHINVHRISRIPFVHGIRPSFSWKKVICDGFMFFKAIRLASRTRYRLVHAVEESVFIALVLKWLFRIPYIYDMDSSLAQQMVEKYPVLSPLRFLLNSCERLAVRNAEVVVPVCDALVAVAKEYRAKKCVVLPDVSLLTDVRKGKV